MLARSIAIILILFTSSAYAAVETQAHLNELAKEFIQKNITLSEDETLEVKISDSGSHLQLAQCENPIQVSLPEGASSQQIQNIKMSCTGNIKWEVYVPVDTRILTKVIVAKQTIPARQVISEDMLDYALRDKNTLYSGYFKSPSEVVGQTPLSTILPGIVISRRNIQQPILINRNQSVSIVAKHGAIMVKAEGIAKTSGALNDTIKVLNPSSKRTIDAVVVNSNTVEVKA